MPSIHFPDFACLVVSEGSVALNCRDNGELLFVSERDGNMELYKAKDDDETKHKELKRLTFTPTMQVLSYPDLIQC